MDRIIDCYSEGALIASYPFSDYGYGESLTGLATEADLIGRAERMLFRDPSLQQWAQPLSLIVRGG